jgi:hypothetical protein
MIANTSVTCLQDHAWASIMIPKQSSAIQSQIPMNFLVIGTLLILSATQRSKLLHQDLSSTMVNAEEKMVRT